MISYKVELILTLIFFTSYFGLDNIYASLFSPKKLEDLKKMRNFDVIHCEQIITFAGFDSNNGLYNYSLTMQFNDSEILEKYLKNNIDSISDNDIKTIVKFYNAIKAKGIDIKYIPQTPKQFCEELDANERKTYVHIHLENETDIVKPKTFCDELDILKTPEEFCINVVKDMELFKTIVEEELQLKEFDISKTPDEFCKSDIKDMELFESIVYEELQLNGNNVEPKTFCDKLEIIMHFYDKSEKIDEGDIPMTPKQFCETFDANESKRYVYNHLEKENILKTPEEFCINVAFKVTLYESIIYEELKTNEFAEDFDIAMTPDEFCRRGEKDKQFYKPFISDQIIEAASKKFQEDVGKLKSTEEFCSGFFKENFNERCICATKLLNSNYYSPYADDVESYKVCKRWKNLEDLSIYETMYYEYHKEMFDKMDKTLISTCSKLIKENDYFGDDPYINIVKSYTFYRTSIFGTIGLLKVKDNVFKEYYKRIEKPTGIRWSNEYHLSEIQRKYYNFHYSAFDKLDNKVPSMCPRAIKKKGYYSDERFSNFVKSYTYYLMSNIFTKDNTKSIRIEEHSEKRESDIKELSDIQMKYYNYHKLQFNKLDNKMCSRAIKKKGYYSDEPFSNFVKSYTYYHKISHWAYNQPGQMWENENNLSKIQKQYYEYHKLAFDTQDKIMCTISIKKNKYYNDNPLFNFIKSFTFCRNSKTLEENMATEKKKCDGINHAVNPNGCHRLYEIIARKDTKTTNIEILTSVIWRSINQLSEFQKIYYNYQKNIFESQNQILNEQYNVKKFCEENTISQP